MHEIHFMGKTPPLFGRGVEKHRHHRGRAAKMSHLMIRNGGKYLLRPYPAQADMGSREQRERPGETPAIAVEHRQRPEIDRTLAHAAGEDIRISHERRAAMMADHTFWITRGARSVIERNR